MKSIWFQIVLNLFFLFNCCFGLDWIEELKKENQILLDLRKKLTDAQWNYESNLTKYNEEIFVSHFLSHFTNVNLASFFLGQSQH